MIGLSTTFDRDGASIRWFSGVDTDWGKSVGGIEEWWRYGRSEVKLRIDQRDTVTVGGRYVRATPHDPYEVEALTLAEGPGGRILVADRERRIEYRFEDAWMVESSVSIEDDGDVGGSVGGGYFVGQWGGPDLYFRLTFSDAYDEQRYFCGHSFRGSAYRGGPGFFGGCSREWLERVNLRIGYSAVAVNGDFQHGVSGVLGVWARLSASASGFLPQYALLEYSREFKGEEQFRIMTTVVDFDEEEKPFYVSAISIAWVNDRGRYPWKGVRVTFTWFIN